MRQVGRRTLRRLITREILWNGNREHLRNLRVWHHDSIIWWAWTQHAKYEDRYRRSMESPALEHIEFVRLRSHAEADAWLEGVTACRRCVR
jgi:hypothetical protein